MLNAKQIKEELNNRKNHSAWSKAVTLYALELLEDIPNGTPITRKLLLNGANSWGQYSYGGCSLISDIEIAERVCTPSELKRKKGGELQPMRNINWLDVQARALYQACDLILRLAQN